MRKDVILEIVEPLSDDIELVELFRRLYVLDKIEQGERLLREEGGVPHEVVARRFSQ